MGLHGSSPHTLPYLRTHTSEALKTQLLHSQAHSTQQTHRRTTQLYLQITWKAPNANRTCEAYSQMNLWHLLHTRRHQGQVFRQAPARNVLRTALSARSAPCHDRESIYCSARPGTQHHNRPAHEGEQHHRPLLELPSWPQ